jgi:cell division protein FtsW (lipid II flippase)
MPNGDELLRIYYEQTVASYTREADLLFERTNYFLAAMAFLIVAFVTLILKPEWANSLIVTNVVMVLGLFLAVLFWGTNLVAQAVILRHRDYIYEAEDRLGIAETPGRAAGLPGPYNGEFPDLKPKSSYPSLLRRPAFHTVAIPILFFIFWSFMLIYLSRSNCTALVVESIIIAVFFVAGVFSTVRGIDYVLGSRHDALKVRQK